MWYWFILLCVLEFVSDVLAKEHVIKRELLYAVLSIVGFVLANTAWIYSLRSGMLLSIGAVLFGVITGIMAVAVGILVYREDITRIHLVGIFLGIVSIGLLSGGNN